MRFIDIYFEYKKKNSNYIIICKMGNFYNIFGDDSRIINFLTNYKINCDENIYKVGFPLIALDKVLKKLKDERINYIVLEKIEGIIKATSKKRFNENMYDYFKDKGSKCYEYKKRIENISIKLNSKIYDNNINHILDQIEEFV